MKRLVRWIRRCIPAPIKDLLKKYIKAPLDQFFRDHTTFETEVRWKAFFRPRYRKANIACSKKVRSWIVNAEKEKKPGKKMTVVFLCQYYAAWNASMSTFWTAVNDPEIDVYLLALPEKKLKPGPDEKISYITHEEYAENLAYPFCRDFFPDTIDAYDEKENRWFNIAALYPDYVFVQRPYQMYLPPQYRCTVLATYTKVCYIPYSYCKQLWDSRSVYRSGFIDYTYAVFTENQMYRDMLRRIYCGSFSAPWKKIEYFGYPRFDVYHSKQVKSNGFKKTVLWLPRWTTSSKIEATTFFTYKDILIEYFKNHPDMKLICRPHPKTFGHFIAIGAMTEAEVDEFKRLFAQTENFMLDESGDYLPAFNEADIFISDTSSLLVEEFSTGKPIIFCGSMSRFDAAAREWAQYMYSVSGEQELMARLNDLLDGRDPNRELREDFVRESMKHDGKSGERIVNFLKEDFKNSFLIRITPYPPVGKGR